jgi:hypothetical protein
MIPLPDQEKVYAAVHKIQGLSGDQIDREIRARIGDPMMAAFATVARTLDGDNPDERTTAKRVRLMVYAYLLCTEGFSDLFAAADGAAKGKSP